MIFPFACLLTHVHARAHTGELVCMHTNASMVKLFAYQSLNEKYLRNLLGLFLSSNRYISVNSTSSPSVMYPPSSPTAYKS